MFKKTICMSLFAALAFSAHATTFVLDDTHTTIGFSVKHMLVANVKGSFGKFSGTVNYDPSAPENTSASAVIQVASVDTANEKRDEHLRNSDFFDAEQFPEITFETTSVQGEAPNMTLTGNLTMKGVTQEIRIPVELNGPVTDPWGNQRIGLSGGAEINRQDFGITWSKSMDGGGLVVGDIVKLILEIEAIAQK